MAFEGLTEKLQGALRKLGSKGKLTEKKHNFELEKCDATVLCVDAYQSGIGSNSCGPALAECYRVPRGMHFKCTFSVFRK